MTNIARKLALALLAGTALVAAPGLAAAQSNGNSQSNASQQTSGQSGNASQQSGDNGPAISGPSSQQLLHAASNSADWMLPAGNYSGNRQIDEDQITPQNVKQMKVAWTFKFPHEGPVEASPIVYDGTVFITDSRDGVYAIDAKTGKLRWQYQPNPTQIVGFPRNRGVGIYEGNVYVATLDGHIVALNASDGKVVWDKQEVHNPKDSFYTMQPVFYKGMLLIGVSDGDWGGIGNISAFNPKNGDRIWEWQTIPGPGEPGHASWSGDSWKRGGGAVWSGLAIDPQSGILYIDAGNPQPDFMGAIREGANLYTDSMIALDISGSHPRMLWYHQFIPHDTHDWDPAMPPVLFSARIDGKETKLVAAGDKAGNFWILNAETGKLVSNTPVSYQLNQNTYPPEEGSNYACPNTNGGVEYNGGSYDPATNTFFVPSSDQCGKWHAVEKPQWIAGQFYIGGSFPSLIGPNTGWFNAIDVGTGTFQWRHHLDLPANGGALVMTDGPNSIVFTGLLNGNFDAYDAKSGKLLWRHQTGGSITAPPATFVMDGHRCVIVASGGPGFLKAPNMHGAGSEAVVTAFEAPASSQQANQHSHQG